MDSYKPCCSNSLPRKQQCLACADYWRAYMRRYMAIWQDERKKAKICQECGKVRVERGHTRCKECLALHRGIRYDKYALPDPNRRYRSVSA